jgi:ribosomal protein S18 acetylase RimI-like enzyme
METMIIVSPLKTFSKDAAAELNALAAKLRETSKKPLPSVARDLKALLRSKDAVLLVAKDGKTIVGMAMLFMLQKIGKKTATVEDVVVLESYRGRGIGEKLMRAIIAEGKKQRVRSLSLTSRPSRIAANKLYQKLGFARKETNVYTFPY